MAVASTSIFLAAAFPQAVHANVNWDSGFQIVYNDPCDGCFHLEAFSWNGPQVGDATVNLEIYDVSSNTWQVVLSENYNYLEGVYDFSLCIDLIDVPWGKQDYRVQFEFLVDGNCPTSHWNGEHYIWYSNPVTVHVANYPTPPEFTITNSQAGPNDIRIVDNCGEITYTLNFNYIPNSEYFGEYTIWESDATGSKIAPIITRDQGSWINFITFDQLIGLLQGDFSNLIDPTVGLPGYQGYNGFVLIELELEHTLNCGYSPHTRDLLVQINELPFVSNFFFRYLDPQSDPTSPTYIDQVPAQSPSNPTLIGGQSGEVISTITSQFYSSWEMNVYWHNGGSPILVGQRNGTGPLSSNFQQPISNASLNYGSGTVGGITDAPIHNPDEIYLFELIVTSINCGSDVYSGYFSVPSSLLLNKTSGNVVSLPNNQVEVVLVNAAKATNVGDLNVVVFDVGGRKALQRSFSEGEPLIFERPMAKGVYLVQVEDQKGNLLWSQKLLN
jgi:hypothetical protein